MLILYIKTILIQIKKKTNPLSNVLKIGMIHSLVKNSKRVKSVKWLSLRDAK